MAKYLVTGGAGFIGSHLCARLCSDGHDVRALDDLSSGHRANLDGVDVDLIVGDLRDQEALECAMEGADYVLHHAAIASVQYSVEHPLQEQDVNVVGTLRLLEAARVAGVKRVVFAASAAAYGADETVPKQESMPALPISPYGLSKVSGEHYCRVWSHVYELETVCLRYFNIFGPRQDPASPYSGVISIFARAMIDGRAPMIHGDGEQSRDFTYVDNVVEANLRACAMEKTAGQVYNIGCARAITINQLVQAINTALGSELVPKHVTSRSGDVRVSLADITAARDTLGYSPTTAFEEGLARTLDWMKGD
ncbi:MAG: SDR family oxidoreductase [Gemmatimonadetes bacterium]|jgi:UDP-glucose 4-epimerase|nr:SDR family oxidoreductase [Gemmatimonadota bacterium]MBT4612551.1 SDR family oxidoreductase [Gemmatimonadota bacterium]MBT5056561.1 SDR family oxidoreductase [Gemmatimonadota bacterium]MBT5145257.1 SDR family oxidoreductase [Gemmatimonadota bacterium]MBT5589638.1 SDR family oxidoreductase [Gemmatimonadota bacterium]